MPEMKTLTIRRANKADLEVVLGFARAFHLEDGHPLSSTGPKAIESLLGGSPLGEIYLPEIEGEKIGYFALCFTMSLEFGGIVVILDDLFLKPDFRGRGLGEEILRYVEKLAKDRGAVQIFLEVENENPRAFAFYKKFGWIKRDRHMMEKNFTV